MYVHIFGYGSLLNEASLRAASPTAEILEWVTLHGYCRKLNAIAGGFPDVALNIVPSLESAFEGVLVKLSEIGLPAMQSREEGCEMVDVSDLLQPKLNERVYTFVAPDVNEYSNKKIHQSYLDTCLGGVAEEKKGIVAQ
jgi:hypothetical protein